MAPRSKALSNIASMIMSDSEPDFDDVEAIGIHIPATREVSGKAQAAKRTHSRTGSSSNRVTKPSQRLGRRLNGSAEPGLSTARQILVEKNKNNTVIRCGTEKRHLDELNDVNSEAASHLASSFEQNKAKDPKRNHDQMHARTSSGVYAQDIVLDPESKSSDFHKKAESVQQLRPQETVTYLNEEQRYSAASSEKMDDVSTRRRLGELAKKYESLETRHNELRDVGVKAAERNFERLKAQAEENASASNKLIQSLKEELNAQSELVKQGEQVRRQLERSEINVSDLEKKIDDLTASLSNARSEVKSLSAKLAASRAAEASVRAPSSALKSGAAGNRTTPSEVVLAAQAKEDLYGDLTGLIVRGMSRSDEENVFDCIQTGRNGTLHFKLSLEAGNESDTYDDAQFTYRPQLDEDRDSELMQILPEFLRIDITFPRTQASKFYSRVNKSLTERLG